MKQISNSTLIINAIISLAGAYLGAIFVQDSLNFFDWSSFDQGLCILISCIFYTIQYKLEKSRLNKEV